MNLKAVLFDMDGVIVDTEPLHRKSYFRMFEDVGIDVSESLYNSFTGQATLPICRTLCEHFDIAHKAEELVAAKRKHFKYLFENDSDLALLDGVHDLIKDYYNNDLTLVLASSASMPNINRIFERFDLNQYFKAKISGADLKASKPHPEIFLKAAQLAEESRENCMVIEDSTNGIAAAHAAGIYCVGYKSPHSTDQDYSKANKVISRFEEIKYNKLLNTL
ncbi:HAD family hydrolase [Aequorivita viscosa]|uniref:Haloacid dehalogenase superfamily, subfamily IA, variant 3 with third motif having DD or ED/haloacid dehalogenase superfamily, subfamily IA, variant 1 with third motif having Dx(3-4)D or Dx(3-4)E n=1 Tax=Aequorivita viscosa TaxID=797419 RepID=A0A1M6NGR2_9FLAO|nr:HAD family phosphatase [Aequorivita viscosa]SDX35279.1 haloacid dehalogenase superfamily, subfamily IA, variant 3 with third motif having DD or ED/haloacid dehalogenase superfamily, subfamily IA, variant 1 with third motif having Dx(3-4)D or Dx(3-4)E [Aequorivita viscosa]SHJ94918.1 haloacid dehalogenase superfamily, subfamily IA, variant 3 with third motif having DD or ED/haloacid dehalogenase superfamily, subfamily IA, variant 1 with third motif having Dx(3-4)D or Dx(3-4)E [Aequorivita viscos